MEFTSSPSSKLHTRLLLHQFCMNLLSERGELNKTNANRVSCEALYEASLNRKTRLKAYPFQARKQFELWRDFSCSMSINWKWIFIFHFGYSSARLSEKRKCHSSSKKFGSKVINRQYLHRKTGLKAYLFQAVWTLLHYSVNWKWIFIFHFGLMLLVQQDWVRKENVIHSLR